MINTETAQTIHTTVAEQSTYYPIGFQYDVLPDTGAPELLVTLDGAPLTYGTDYTVNVAGLQLVNAPEAGQVLTIKRDVAFTQEIDLQTGFISPDQIENGLDRAVMRDQELKRNVLDVAAALAEEQEERRVADAGLQEAIDNEVLARTAADTTLQDNIDDEALTRANMDAALRIDIDSKQPAIGDLETIRAGAAAGATAVQPDDLADVATSGSYNDLLDKPTNIVNSVNGQTGDVRLSAESVGAVSTAGGSKILGDLKFAFSQDNPGITLRGDSASGLFIVNNETQNTTLQVGKNGDLYPGTAGRQIGTMSKPYGTIYTQRISNTQGNFIDVPQSGGTMARIEDLSTVARTGSYNDLTNKPTIPTVGAGTITIKQGGETKGSFNVNQGTDTEIEIEEGGTDVDYNRVVEKTASALPTPTATLNGKAYMYVGETDWDDNTKRNGAIYECTQGVVSASVSSSFVSQTISGVEIWSEDLLLQYLGFSSRDATAVFAYVSSEWQYNGDTVDLGPIGIDVWGTPSNGDTITIVYTAAAKGYVWKPVDNKYFKFPPLVEYTNEIIQYIGWGNEKGKFYWVEQTSHSGPQYSIAQTAGTELSGLGMGWEAWKFGDQLGWPQEEKDVRFVYAGQGTLDGNVSYSFPSGLEATLDLQTFAARLQVQRPDATADTYYVRYFSDESMWKVFRGNDDEVAWGIDTAEWGLTITSGTPATDDVVTIVLTSLGGDQWEEYIDGTLFKSVPAKAWGIVYDGTPEAGVELLGHFTPESNTYGWKEIKNIGGASKAVTKQLTIEDWQNNEQTVSNFDDFPLGQANALIVTPTPESMDAYVSAGIMCISHNEWSVTFSCKTVPSVELSVNIAII